jgi:hypothetical protein
MLLFNDNGLPVDGEAIDMIVYHHWRRRASAGDGNGKNSSIPVDAPETAVDIPPYRQFPRRADRRDERRNRQKMTFRWFAPQHAGDTSTD